MNKLTIQALALTGILAVSGLPALAAEMTPTPPAPNASISTDGKAKVAMPSASVDTKAKASVAKSKSTAAKKADKTTKKVAKDTKNKVHQQTAQHPAAAPLPPVGGSAGANTSVGVGNSGVNGSAGATVQD